MPRPQPPSGPCPDIIFPGQLRDVRNRRDLGVAEQNIVGHVQVGCPLLKYAERLLVVRSVMDLIPAEYHEVQFGKPLELPEGVDEQGDALLTVLPGAVAVYVEVKIGDMGEIEFRDVNRFRKRDEYVSGCGQPCQCGNAFQKGTPVHHHWSSPLPPDGND